MSSPALAGVVARARGKNARRVRPASDSKGGSGPLLLRAGRADRGRRLSAAYRGHTIVSETGSSSVSVPVYLRPGGIRAREYTANVIGSTAAAGGSGGQRQTAFGGIQTETRSVPLRCQHSSRVLSPCPCWRWRVRDASGAIRLARLRRGRPGAFGGIQTETRSVPLRCQHVRCILTRANSARAQVYICANHTNRGGSSVLIEGD
jgi:hypothetical protein